MQQRLTELLTGLTTAEDLETVEVGGLTDRAQAVHPGDLYLAVQGTMVHGLDFLDQAVANGARAVAYEPVAGYEPERDDVTLVAVPDLHKYIGVIADRFFARPSSRLQVIAITGTDGKSSIAYLGAQTLRRQFGSCGLLGTLGYGELEDLHPATHTTPPALHLHNEIFALKERGVRHVVLEASSHGLDQGRLAGLSVDVAVFTMLGRDHLDYHASPEAYRAAKRKLFELPGLQWAVLNMDDEFGRSLAEFCESRCKVLGYSLDAEADADISARDIVLREEGLTFELVYQGECYPIHSRLLGRFNVSSLLATFGILLTQGVTAKDGAALLGKINPVPGRMQLFSAPGKPHVIVDYAHTPEALERVLQTCREISKGHLHCVFGCGGNRDKGKRRLMGEVASRLADRVTLTDDNPRDEDPEAIIRDIQKGVMTDAEIKIERDRGGAIKRAIQQSQADDYVLIAGKGNEDYQLVRGVKIPMTDHQFVAAAFAECA